MAGNISTPISVWGNFKIQAGSDVEIIEEIKSAVTVDRIYFDGRPVGSERVKIYGYLARPKTEGTVPALLIVGDGSGTDEEFARRLAKAGYCALAVDFKGKIPEKQYFTEYPEKVGYAEYSRGTSFAPSLGGSVLDSCWYEWGAVVRYGVAFLRSQDFINKVGVIGVREGAIPAYHGVSFDDKLSCAVFISNVGYFDQNKMLDKESIKYGLSDDNLRFIAGVEPQSYAQHIKCPTLFLCPTDCKESDCDGAGELIAKINQQYYSALDYYPNLSDSIGYAGYKELLFFLRGVIGSEGITLPKRPEIKTVVSAEAITVSVKAEENELKSLSVYVAEKGLGDRKRSWQVVHCSPNAVIELSYQPTIKSDMVYFFAKAVYKNGYSVCSNVADKKLNEKIKRKVRSVNVLYSGKEKTGESIFAGIKEENNGYIIFEDKFSPVKKRGSMDIEGVGAEGGLITYKICAEKDKPRDDAILMFDVFMKNGGEFTVELSGLIKEEKVKYRATVKIVGGMIWHNVKLPMAKFKTEEGRILKSYGSIYSLSFLTDGNFLINNLLWI